MDRAAGLLLILLAGAGCTDGNAPPLLSAADLGADLAASAGCSTACDCPAGEACRMGSCEVAQQMVFCCGTAACTGAALCQSPDGTISQCDRPDGGVAPSTDGGVSQSTCEMTGCTQGAAGDVFCKLACGSTAAMCIKTGGIEHCMP